MKPVWPTLLGFDRHCQISQELMENHGGFSFVNSTFHKPETPSVPPGLLIMKQSVKSY